MAEALYRKYRPQTFDDVVGQTHIERTLKNAIESDKVSHAYLFCGPRGTGKTTTARILAKALMCESGPTPTPDDTCEQCRQITLGIHPDVNEMDAASRTGVENVREEIIGRVQFAPTFGRRKIYIIDEVHMLTVAAFNALLKTLEEPPSHVVFILCTTDPQKIPETILSRCQRFDFHRLSNDEILSRLEQVCQAEGASFDPQALRMVAQRAQGGMRDALTALEQVLAFGNGEASLDAARLAMGLSSSEALDGLVDCLARRDTAACFTWMEEFSQSGGDLVQFCKELTGRIRDLFVVKATGGSVSLSAPEGDAGQLANQAAALGPDRLTYLLEELGKVGQELKTSTNARLTFEMFLVRASRPETDLTLEALAARVEALEAALAAGGVPASASTPQAQVRPTAPAPAPAAAPAPVSAPAVARQAAPAPRQAVPAPTPRAQVRPAAPAAAVVPTPTPAPAPMPAAVQDASTQTAPLTGLAAVIGNPISLQKHWKVALKALTEKKEAWGSLLMSARVMPSADGAGIEFQYPAENDFAFNVANGPDIKAALAEALAGAFGQNVPFTITKGQSAQAAQAVAGAQAATAAIAAARAAKETAQRRGAAGRGSMQSPAAPAFGSVPGRSAAAGSAAASAAALTRSAAGKPSGFDAAAVVAATRSVVENAPAAKPKFVQRGKQIPVTPDTLPPEDDVVPYSDADVAGYADEAYGYVAPWEELPAAKPAAAPAAPAVVPPAAPKPVAQPAPTPAPAQVAPAVAPAPAPAPAPAAPAVPAPTPAPAAPESPQGAGRFAMPSKNPFAEGAGTQQARQRATHTSFMPDGPEPVDPYPAGLALGFDSMPDPAQAKGTVEPEGWPGVGKAAEAEQLQSKRQAQTAAQFMSFKEQADKDAAAASAKANGVGADAAKGASPQASPQEEMDMASIFGAFGVSMDEVSEY